MLRDDTEKIWLHLQNHPLLSEFVLAGGTALSMHLNHRVSEDLDFMYPGSSRLPRVQIELLKKECLDAGFEFRSNDSPAGILEFEDTGMDYHDYQQDYIVNGTVKLTLVAPDLEVSKLIGPTIKTGPRVATTEEVFRMKCMACANRSKSRDWLDIFVMLKMDLFKPIEIFESFKLAGVPSKFDIAMMRMSSGRLHVMDEGYDALMDNPPSIENIHSYFVDMFKDLQSHVVQLKARDSKIEMNPKKISKGSGMRSP